MRRYLRIGIGLVAALGVVAAGGVAVAATAPKLPPEVVDATSKRYLEAYRRLTGSELKVS